MKNYICPISGNFKDIVKICQYFNEQDDFDVHLTGTWGISAIISWSDKTMNYLKVKAKIYGIINESITS